ncbi:MAG: class I SAM-dependent methyltransferase [Terriglobia bacterium]
MNRQQHWESIYASKSDGDLSWTQPEPRLSLSLIEEVCPRGRIVDVGGGTSSLATRLLDAGYTVAVLDISEAALSHARMRVGSRGDEVRWIAADVTASPDLGTFDVWHDRAVFHFLTGPADRAAYVARMARTVSQGGHVVIATFALDGPEKCSGLEVCRYDGRTLADTVGKEFSLLKSERELHLTPPGKVQPFQYSLFRRA